MAIKHLISTGASLAIALVLVGAGCNGSATTNIDGSANTGTGSAGIEANTDASVDTGAMIDDSSDAHIEVLDGGESTQEDAGGSMETKSEASVNVNADVGAESDLIVQPVKTFDMTARQWEFSPETITVNEGDRVVLNIASQDVTHGFAIPQFNVNEQLEPGQTTRVEFVADNAGTYTFFCSVFCGSGHPQMQGTLIVN